MPDRAPEKKREGQKRKPKPAADGAFLPEWVFRPGPGPQGSRPPWLIFAAVLAAAWAARVAVALIGEFILHPDELYQYYEPAHGVVFGNAIYTWEIVTGARSFLIPGFIAGILYVIDYFGYGEPIYYVPAVKVAFCTVSLALPVSMYFIARSLWSERAGVMAFLFGCFWYEFVGFAHKPLSDMVSSYAAMASIAFACARVRSPATLILSGLAAALTIGLRWQVGIMLVPFALLLLCDLGWRQRRDYVLAGLAGMAVVGLLDHLAWGGVFHSIYLNIVSNLEVNPLLNVERQASDVHYFLWMAWASVGMFWIVFLFALSDWRRYAPFLALIIVFLATHTLLIHKEYRFAFPWLPLWVMMAADMAARIAGRLEKAGRTPLPALGGAGALAAVMSAFGIANALPYQDELYYDYSLSEFEVSFLEKDPHLELYLRLSQDDALDGLLEVARPLPSTGGFYYLHRRVAILPPLIFQQIAEATGEQPDIRNWVTHVVTKPGTPPQPGFSVRASTPDYTLFRVTAANRVNVFRLTNHVYAPDLQLMMLAIPTLRQYHPPDRDFRIHFGNR